MESSIRGNTSKSSESSIGVSNSGDCSVNVGNNVSRKTSKQTLTTESSIRVGKNSRDNSLLFLSITLSLGNNLRNNLSFNSLNNRKNLLLTGSSSSIGSFKYSPGGLNLISFSNSN